MSILLSSIVTQIRNVLRDPAAQNLTEYTEAQLLFYLGEGFRDAQTELSLVDQDFFETNYTFNFTSGQKAYPVPADFRALTWLKRIDLSPEDDIVEVETEQEFRNLEKITGSPATARGSLKYRLKGNYIHIVPVIASTVASAAVMTYEKAIVPEDGWTTSAVSLDTELPANWTNYAIWQAAAYACHQDEENPGYFSQTADKKLGRLKNGYADRDKGPRYVKDPYGLLED